MVGCLLYFASPRAPPVRNQLLAALSFFASTLFIFAQLHPFAFNAVPEDTCSQCFWLPSPFGRSISCSFSFTSTLSILYLGKQHTYLLTCSLCLPLTTTLGQNIFRQTFSLLRLSSLRYNLHFYSVLLIHFYRPPTLPLYSLLLLQFAAAVICT